MITELQLKNTKQLQLILVLFFAVFTLHSQQLPDSVQKFFLALPYDSSATQMLKTIESSSVFEAKEFDKRKTMINARISKPAYFKHKPDSAFIHVHEHTTPSDTIPGKPKGSVTVITAFYSSKNKSNYEFNKLGLLLKEETRNKKFRMETEVKGRITVFSDAIYPQINAYVEEALNGSKIIIVKIETPAPKK